MLNNYGMQLDLPPLFGSLQKRACPYVQAHAAVIRSDGAVVPCFKNLYPHSAYFQRTHACIYALMCSVPSPHTSFIDIWNSTQIQPVP